MGDLAGFRYRDVVKVLKQFGFAQCREAKGSHQIWKNAEGYTTIPYHAKKDIPEGTLHHILKQAGITKEDFLSRRP